MEDIKGKTENAVDPASRG